MIYRLMLALSLLAIGVQPSAALEIKADPNKRVVLSGTLDIDGEEYVLSFKECLTCITSEGAEDMDKIYIGVTPNAVSRYKFLKKYKNKQVRLSGIIDNPRGACVFYGVKLR